MQYIIDKYEIITEKTIKISSNLVEIYTILVGGKFFDLWNTISKDICLSIHSHIPRLVYHKNTLEIKNEKYEDIRMISISISTRKVKFIYQQQEIERDF